MFTGIFFGLASLGYVLYFQRYYSLMYGLVFLAAMSPVIVFFTQWFVKTLKNESNANYTNTMRLNWISATCLGGFFLYLFLHSTNILSVVGVY